MKTAEFFLASEAARELNCSATRVRALASRGDLKVARTPTGTRIFLAEDVRKLAEREKQNRK